MEFKKVIDAAIKQEESSYKLYMRGYKLTTAISAKQLFNKLAEQELMHKRLLKNLDLKEAIDFPDGKYESLKLEEELLLTPVNELKEIKEILKFSIKKEVRAYKQYFGIAKTLPFGKMKTFFEKLAGEEQKHKELVKQEYRKLF